jgi:hypothetical protein
MHPDTDQRIPGTVGTAFDYRLRYYLALTPLEDPARLRRVRAMSSFGSSATTRPASRREGELGPMTAENAKSCEREGPQDLTQRRSHTERFQVKRLPEVWAAAISTEQ